MWICLDQRTFDHIWILPYPPEQKCEYQEKTPERISWAGVFVMEMVFP